MVLPNTEKYRKYTLDQLLGLRTGLKNDDPNVLDVDSAIIEKIETVEDYLNVFNKALGNSDLEKIALTGLALIRDKITPEKRYFILNKANLIKEILDFVYPE